MDIFHDWTPREIEAMQRATAWLRAKQPPYESEQPRTQPNAPGGTTEPRKVIAEGKTEYSEPWTIWHMTKKPMIKNKRCSKCKSHKNTDQFHKNRSTNDGFVSWCKRCISSKYKEENKDKIEAKNKRIAKNQEQKKAKEKARSAKRYKENRDHILATGKKWS